MMRNAYWRGDDGESVGRKRTNLPEKINELYSQMNNDERQQIALGLIEVDYYTSDALGVEEIKSGMTMDDLAVWKLAEDWHLKRTFTSTSAVSEIKTQQLLSMIEDAVRGTKPTDELKDEEKTGLKGKLRTLFE